MIMKSYILESIVLSQGVYYKLFLLIILLHECSNELNVRIGKRAQKRVSEWVEKLRVCVGGRGAVSSIVSIRSSPWVLLPVYFGVRPPNERAP